MNKLSTILILCAILLTPIFTNAQNMISTPIGGPLIFALPCTCSGGILMYIFDYRTLMVVPVVYQPLVSLYDTPQNAGGLYTPGTFQLGEYVPKGICLVGAPPECSDVNNKGTYTPIFPGFGNSLVPSFTGF